MQTPIKDRGFRICTSFRAARPRAAPAAKAALTIRPYRSQNLRKALVDLGGKACRKACDRAMTEGAIAGLAAVIFTFVARIPDLRPKQGKAVAPPESSAS
jgi:hypothetical protein